MVDRRCALSFRALDRVQALVGVGVLMVSSAAGVASAQTFTYSGAVQTFVVPATGQYDLVAYGAQGGSGRDFRSVVYAGGQGAQIGGRFLLTAGTTINILVGGAGATGTFSGAPLSGGGGGASAVYITGAAQPMVMAGGGGGGGGAESIASFGRSGEIGTSGSAGMQFASWLSGAGGVGGNGGAASAPSGGAQVTSGGGGAGWLTDGGVLIGAFVNITAARTGPSWAGGTSNQTNLGGHGGFGGGATGAGSGGGGGGGYSGGGGGNFGGGGGGGSYVDSSALLSLDAFAGVQQGHGLVTITLVPTPGAAAVLAMGGVIAARRRRA